MSHRKEVLTAVGTLAIAVGIGFIMQRTDAAEERYGAQTPVAYQGLASASVILDSAILDTVSTEEVIEVQAIELTSGSDVMPAPTRSAPEALRPVSASPDEVLVAPSKERLPTFGACDMTLTADAVPGALVRLALDAPCALNERLVVHHNGLMFTQATDDTGNLSIVVPALAEDAVFILAFANGDGAVTTVNVPDLERYERVAVQWRGTAGFELHAREFGAGYGDDGHVWSGAATDLAGMQAGENGYLMRLGSEAVADPLVAEVYSFATSMAARDGVIALSVEAEVTADNCGRSVEAQSFEVFATAEMKTRDLTLDVPSCDAIGDFLVLNNLITDMKVAAN